jgi:hypothetical protein
MLEISFIIAFVVLFLHATTWEGMIFSFIPEFFYDAPAWVRKPIFECPICMTPWYGAFIMIASDYYPANNFQPFIVLFVAGGINVIADCFIKFVGNDSGAGSIE